MNPSYSKYHCQPRIIRNKEKRSREDLLYFSRLKYHHESIIKPFSCFFDIIISSSNQQILKFVRISLKNSYITITK